VTNPSASTLVIGSSAVTGPGNRSVVTTPALMQQINPSRQLRYFVSIESAAVETEW